MRSKTLTRDRPVKGRPTCFTQQRYWVTEQKVLNTVFKVVAVMRTRQNAIYTIQNEALYIYVVRFVNKLPVAVSFVVFCASRSCIVIKRPSSTNFAQKLTHPVDFSVGHIWRTANCCRMVSSEKYTRRCCIAISPKTPQLKSLFAD